MLLLVYTTIRLFQAAVRHTGEEVERETISSLSLVFVMHDEESYITLQITAKLCRVGGDGAKAIIIV